MVEEVNHSTSFYDVETPQGGAAKPGGVGVFSPSYKEKERFDQLALMMALVAAGVYWLFFLGTRPYEFPMDIWGHLKYLRFVAEHGALPAPDYAWLTYHPPLYYLITGALLRFYEWAGVERTVQLLRLFSLPCFVVFVWYGWRSLCLMLPSRSTALYSAYALLLFWPVGVLIASRIDSHVLLYPLFAGGLYHALRVRKFGDVRDVSFCLMFAAFALLARTSALLLLPMLALAMWPHVRARRINVLLLLRDSTLISSSLLLLAVMFFLVLRAGGAPEPIANFEALGQDLHIENTLAHFTLFPIGMYLDPPFHLVKLDATGRQYYWLGLLKSALWGEYRVGAPLLASVVNGLLLLLLAYTAAAWVLVRGARTSPMARYAACVMLLMVVASTCMRLMYPAASTQDFRYIYPLLIPLLALFGRAQLRYHHAGRHRVATAGAWIAIIFATLSVMQVMNAALMR